MRCRFYPRCAVHLGDERPRQFSADNLREMRSMSQTGWTPDEIAAVFGSSPKYVRHVLGGKK